MLFLAAETIHIGQRQTATGPGQVSIRIIPVTRRQIFTRSHQVRDVPIRMVVIVRAPVAANATAISRLPTNG